METETKCGDDCKLVEMLATKTSKEQAMDNAIAAVQTGNISQCAAAKRFGVKQQTLSDRLKKLAGTVTGSGGVTTQSESPPAKPKAADKSERDQWFADHQAGLSARKIAEKFGRSRLSITKEIKRREEASLELDHAPDNSESPAAKPAYDPPIETTENRMFEPEPLTPTGELSGEVKTLTKRERQSMVERVSYIRHLRDFNQAATKHWEHLQRKYKSQGRSVIAHNMKLVSTSLRQDQTLQPWAESLGIPSDSSYEDCVWATIKLARELDKSMRLSLYLAGFIDAPGQMDRLHGS